MSAEQPSTEGSDVRFLVASNSNGECIGVQDEDFGYDVLLRTGGDFGTEDERIDYARAVCAALNAAANRIPTGPAGDRKPEDWPCLPPEPRDDGDWLWCQLMDWCKHVGSPPSMYNDLFKIVGRLRDRQQPQIKEPT